MRAALPAVLILAAGPALAHGGAHIHPGGPAAFLALGFVAGLAHALDADHVAAVAAMMRRGDGTRSAMARGAAWGLGHSASLFLICSAALALGLRISSRVEASLELVVGLTIVALGLRVVWKLRRERVHIHVHEHGGSWHAHAHSHAGETAPHSASPHRHRHRAKALLPTLGVGLVHGAAGSAGLLVLTVAAADSYAAALAAFAVFGIGSLIGMAALTAVASYPLGLASRSGGAIRAVVSVAVAAFALLVGSGVMLESLESLGALEF